MISAMCLTKLVLEVLVRFGDTNYSEIEWDGFDCLCCWCLVVDAPWWCVALDGALFKQVHTALL